MAKVLCEDVLICILFKRYDVFLHSGISKAPKEW